MSEEIPIKLSKDLGRLSTRLEKIGVLTKIKKPTDTLIGTFLNNCHDDSAYEYCLSLISAINEGLDILTGIKVHPSRLKTPDVYLSDVDLIGDCPKCIDS